MPTFTKGDVVQFRHLTATKGVIESVDGKKKNLIYVKWTDYPQPLMHIETDLTLIRKNIIKNIKEYF